jgi:two-component system sensor histidine kinase DegS
VEAYQEQIDLEIEFTATGTERRLERYLEVMIFRAIQELLSNASRHSQATQIRVQLDTTEQNVKATVEDNGQGFDVDRALEGSMGIKVIKDRVEMLGGHITIDAAEDQGTRISFEIPAAMVGGDVFA